MYPFDYDLYKKELELRHRGQMHHYHLHEDRLLRVSHISKPTRRTLALLAAGIIILQALSTL